MFVILVVYSPRFPWRWWTCTPHADTTHLSPPTATWSPWTKTTSTLTQEVRDGRLRTLVVVRAHERTLALRTCRVTLPRPSAAEQLSSWPYNTAVVPGSTQVRVCVCVRASPTRPPLQLLPQAFFAVNKNVFSVSLPGYVRAKKSIGVRKMFSISSLK